MSSQADNDPVEPADEIGTNLAVGDRVRVLYTGTEGEIINVYNEYAWVLYTDDQRNLTYPTTVKMQDLNLV